MIDARGNVTNSSFRASVPVSPATDDVLGRPGATARFTITFEGEDYRVHTIGLQNGGAVEISRSLGETNRVLDDLRRQTIILVILVAVGAAAAGWLIAGTVAAPLRRLTGAAEEVESSGRLDVAVPGDGSDEVGRLGAAFRSMLGALAALARGPGAAGPRRRPRAAHPADQPAHQPGGDAPTSGDDARDA